MERISGMWQNMRMEPILFFDMIYSGQYFGKFLPKNLKFNNRVG